MIIFVKTILKKLLKKGKNYPWPRPSLCPRCKSSHVWGHGFVPAYFDGFKEPLLLRRYRCPCCGCVIRLRPEGYFKRFQASIKTIRASVQGKSTHQRWLSGLSRSRQNHWFRALKRKAMAYFGNAGPDLPEVFDRLMRRGVIPVSRAI